MAHHKRRGPKSTRAGCLMCKAHKIYHQRIGRVGDKASLLRLRERAKDMVQ